MMTMLQLLLGGAGCGKSAAILGEVRQLAAAGQPVMVLVPDQFSFETEREYWQKLGPQLAGQVEVYGFERLAEECFRRYGGLAGRYASETVKLLLMREALKNCRPALNLYRKSAARPDFVGEMLASVEELKRAALSPAELEDAALRCSSEALRDKLADLALITESYQALLARSFLDPTDQLERAAVLAEKHHLFQGYRVYLDGFKSFTARQYQLIGLALTQSEGVTAALCLPPEGGHGLFDGIQETSRRLRALAARCNCPVASPRQLTTPWRFQSPALRHYVEQVLRPLPEPVMGRQEDVVCTALYNPFDEADAVAAEICQLMRQGYRYEDIVVVGRDMDDRASILEAAFDRYQIPSFRDGGETADTMPLIRFVRWYCALAAGNLRREDVLGFLKCGLLEVTVEQIAAFENYTYVWQITGETFRQPFTRHPQGFTDRPMSGRDKNLLAVAEQVRSQVVEATDRLYRSINEQETLAEGLWAALSHLEIPRRMQQQITSLEKQGKETDAENSRRAWDALVTFLEAAKTLSQLRQEEGEQEMTLRELREMLTLAASRQPLVTRPQTLDSVLLGSAQRLRAGEKKIAFLVGAEDRVFPHVPSGGGVFTDRERKLLREDGMQLDNLVEQRLVEERFVAYESAAIPSQRLYISYAMGDVAGKPQSPSALVSGFSQIFPDTPIRSQAELDPLLYCQSPSTAFLQLARCRGQAENSVLAATLKQVLVERPAYEKRLARLEDAARLSRLVMEDPELAWKMFGWKGAVREMRRYVLSRVEPGSRFLVLSRQGGERVMQLSPSQIEKFFRCRFSYFCRYGLHLRPRTRAELNPLARGNTVHYLLEQVLREKDFLTLSEKALRQKIRQHLSRYLDEVMGGASDKPARFLYYYQRLQDTIYGILSALQKELAQTEFEVAGLEESISQGGIIEPLRVQTPDGTILVEGKVDRVDWAELDGQRYVRVIDYKTGRQKFSLEEASQGMGLQMLLYLFAIWQSREGKYHDLLPAGVLYLPARSQTPNLDRYESPSGNRYRMNGLVLSDQRVLRAMERDLGGQFLPVKELKKGEIKGSYQVSLEEFGQLRDQAGELIARMVQELICGRIAPEPQASDNRLPCTFCDYRSICGREGKD